MFLSLMKLMKLWTTVALCCGALSNALGVDANSDPPKVISGQRSPAVALPPDYSSLYGRGFYPHDEPPSGEARNDVQSLENLEDEPALYMDHEPEDGPAMEDQLKRSMGMLRLGKRGRSMAALRLGRSAPERSSWESPSASSSGLSLKRSMGMLRLGRTSRDDDDDEEEEEKRSMGLLRLGRRGNEGSDKRSMGMLRLGRAQGHGYPPLRP